jgi:hypothetical protein
MWPIIAMCAMVIWWIKNIMKTMVIILIWNANVINFQNIYKTLHKKIDCIL